MAGSCARKAPTPSKGAANAKPSSAKRNNSILNFFQKTDTPPGATSSQARITQFVTSSSSPSSGRGTPTLQGGNSAKDDSAGGLFLEDKKGLAKVEHDPVTVETSEEARSRTPDDIWGDGDEFLEPETPRYNEYGSFVKRRKTDSSGTSVEHEQAEAAPQPANPSEPAKAATSGPFIDESDSEDDIDAYEDLDETSAPVDASEESQFSVDHQSPVKHDPAGDPRAELRPLVREITSHVEDDEFANFDDVEEDEPVGEEFRERPWEDEEQELGVDDESDAKDWDGTKTTTADAAVSACPICQKILTRFNETVRNLISRVPHKLIANRILRYTSTTV